MPRVLAGTAAGSSVASWNSAVERLSASRMPSLRSRSPLAQALIGRPGWPPGRARANLFGRVAAANCDLLEGQFSDGRGQVHRNGAEADADHSVRLLAVPTELPGLRVASEVQASIPERVESIDKKAEKTANLSTPSCGMTTATSGPFKLAPTP
ncbi:hypothetical protein [Streptomyces sp. NPDC091212]|uniref:hypothetical protein n=1 Tax=Streptomyces sp. NPDC091212 TaxID=3155191 RepID=UPI00344308EA